MHNGSGHKTQIKCVVVGDGGAGKTSLLSTFATGYFPSDYVPTVFDNYQSGITVNGVSVQLELWDTAGQEDYDKLRPLSYPQTDIFLVCFSIGNRPSFANVAEKWCPEVRRYSPHAPIIVIGTKGDLRTDPEFTQHMRRHNQQPITHKQAADMTASVGAVKFIECSALTGNNLYLVFEDAVRSVLWPESMRAKHKRKNRSCCLQ